MSQVKQMEVQTNRSDSLQLVNDMPERMHIDYEKTVAARRGYRILRRAQDIVLSLCALIVLMPFLMIVALVIWLDSPNGSPFFTQDRVGKDGKVFRFRKFRTMVPDAERMLDGLLIHNEMDGPVFKLKDDPRITRVGRFLRKTSIDELPQLVNVLRGEMSIVGPRPALLREFEQYGDYEKQRLYVKPGLTCYWQIQPRRNSVPFDEWMALDLKYICERSFLVDWKIIFCTVRTVMSMEGE